MDLFQHCRTYYWSNYTPTIFRVLGELVMKHFDLSFLLLLALFVLAIVVVTL